MFGFIRKWLKNIVSEAIQEQTLVAHQYEYFWLILGDCGCGRWIPSKDKLGYFRIVNARGIHSSIPFAHVAELNDEDWLEAIEAVTDNGYQPIGINGSLTDPSKMMVLLRRPKADINEYHEKFAKNR